MRRPALTRSARLRFGASVAAVALLTAGCATNAATGKRQLNFYSEAQEISLGRQADREISAELGVVDDPELQRYVQELGGRLAARSERPQLPWSFKVMDDPVVNAFALPGGFVYVTRGILAHLGSEAELASVLGHEIGHVTAQHGVNQLSKQQVAQGGLILGMAVLPEAARASDLAAAGLGVLFLKYGRDDERQADDLGLRYMTAEGYDAREMPKLFRVLERVSASAGQGRIPNWLSTHPDPGSRRERSERRIQERGYGAGKVERDALFAHLGGLAYGEDPRHGYFEGDVFYHPELRFSLRFPSGWQHANESARVVGVDAGKSALLALSLVQEKTPEEAARAFTAQSGIVAGSSRSSRLNGLAAADAEFTIARTDGSELAGRALFVALRGQVFRLLAVATSERWRSAEPEVERSLGSFSELTDRSKLEVQPQRLEVVRLAKPATFEEFLARQPSDARREVVAVINQIDDAGATLPAGTPLKRVVGRQVGD